MHESPFAIETALSQMMVECERDGLSLPTKVPGYERAIMLLEHEERWAEAMALAKDALHLGIVNEWYDKRIAKYEKLLEANAPTEGEGEKVGS